MMIFDIGLISIRVPNLAMTVVEICGLQPKLSVAWMLLQKNIFENVPKGGIVIVLAVAQSLPLFISMELPAAL